MNPSPTGWPRQVSATPQGWRWPAANRRVIAGDQWPTSQRLYQIAGTTPSLDLNFARTKTLNDAITGRNLVTFTRVQTASNGSTYIAADGLIKTAASNEPRFQHNPTTGESLGLLVEEARTNLVLQSQDAATTWVAISAAVTTNTTVAPDGTTTADTITASSSTIGRIQQTITFTGDGDKAISIWLKAGTSPRTAVNIDDSTAGFVNRLGLNITWTGGVATGSTTQGTLQGIDTYPSGWYRIRALATGLIAANTNRFRIESDTTNGTGSVIVWGAQAENGAFPTSYIPTTTATVTRAADVASITGSNFSSWYNQTEGSFYVENQLPPSNPPAGTFPGVLSANNGTSTNQMMIYWLSTTVGRWFVRESGTITADISASAVTAGSSTRFAVRYASNDAAISANGGAIGSDTSVVLPTVDRLTIGAQAVTAPLNGTIRRLAYWPTRLSNTTLQAITQ
jgi:hypothetical protein